MLLTLSILPSPAAVGKELPRIEGWVANALAAPALPEAEAAILLEPRTGTVLFEKNADRVIPPASLTKIVTIHVARSLAEDQGIDLSAPAPVPEAAWARNMPPGSSLMFLGPGQQVSLQQLFKGMAVSSGNDAAVATAIRIAGSVASFMDTVNRIMRNVGYEVLEFHDPAGLSARNQITAREYADFVAEYIKRWPTALDKLHSVRSYTYPQAANFQPAAVDTGSSRGGNGVVSQSPPTPPITQANRNGLLRSFEGADGIKTGFIEASGYNLAASAERNGYRLIAVVLGIRAQSHENGALVREQATSRLLNFGFDGFELVRFDTPTISSRRVWKGAARTVHVQAPESTSIVVPADRVEDLSGEIDIVPELTAPVRMGQELGEIRYSLGGRVLERVALRAGHEVDRGSILRRIWDTLSLLWRDLFG